MEELLIAYGFEEDEDSGFTKSKYPFEFFINPNNVGIWINREYSFRIPKDKLPMFLESTSVLLPKL